MAAQVFLPPTEMGILISRANVSGRPCFPVFPVYVIPTSRIAPSPSPTSYRKIQHGEKEVAAAALALALALAEHKVIIRWEPPYPGHLKLNTDGSSRGNPGPSSYGGLIRDQHGKWVCGYMGKMGNKITSLVAELWAIFKGFCLIKRKGLQNVIVETDCQAALLLITVETVDENHPQKALIDHCKLVIKECHCFMIHTRREGNHCADQIAKLGGWHPIEYTELAQPPTCLIPFLLADAARIGYQRPSR